MKPGCPLGGGQQHMPATNQERPMRSHGGRGVILPEFFNHITQQYEGDCAEPARLEANSSDSMYYARGFTHKQITKGGVPLIHKDHVAEVARRWYIKLGFAGFNSPANNRSGYKSREAAEAACRRYQNKRG